MGNEEYTYNTNNNPVPSVHNEDVKGKNLKYRPNIKQININKIRVECKCKCKCKCKCTIL